MTGTTEHNAGAGRPTTSPNGEKIPDATRQDNRRKGESRQVAGEGGDRAPQQHEKGDAGRAGGPGHAPNRASDDTQARDADDADRERAMLDRAPAEGRR
jgi:hypothetical protein